MATGSGVGAEVDIDAHPPKGLEEGSPKWHAERKRLRRLAINAAETIANALAAAGAEPYATGSRGGVGVHILVMLDRRIAAGWGRRWLDEIVCAAGYEPGYNNGGIRIEGRALGRRNPSLSPFAHGIHILTPLPRDGASPRRRALMRT